MKLVYPNSQWLVKTFVHEDDGLLKWDTTRDTSESNWVQTWPDKGWDTLFRLYGPLEPWFDKSWKPGDFELVK